jgi:hypothetical protein
MAGKSALPVLALAGAAALLMSKKKKKKTSSGGDIAYDDFVPDSPDPPPKKTSKRPSGNPPCVGERQESGGCYDQMFWGDSTVSRITKIRQYFADLGYPVNVGPWPMNHMGPKGSVEVTNEDGSMGRIGGNDDRPSDIVRQFQNDYNAVSRCKEIPGVFGGLAPDGLVGYYTLDALRAAHDSLGAKTWEDVLRTCATKGFTP